MTPTNTMTAMPATIVVHCDGLTFPVIAYGADGARPIMLLHGFPQEPATWSPVAESLAEQGLRVYVPSQRGYVASTRTPGSVPRMPFVRFAEDAMGIADALRLDRFDVAGFGMGGLQAWMMAAFWPERIRSLTSLRVPHPAAFAQGIRTDPEQQRKWQLLEEQFGAADLEERAAAMLANGAARLRDFLVAVGLPQPFLDRYVARLQTPGTLVGALSWEHCVTFRELGNVPTVAVPTLLLWSDGPGVARASVEATKDYVSARYTQAFIADVGNFILETCPDEVIGPLCRHLHAA